MTLRLLISLVCGILFGLGLAVAQMTDPRKVQSFLDVAGDWDPSLAFVMGGAVFVTLIGFKWVLKRPSPYGDTRFHLPALRHIDTNLLVGAALFGMGWGLTGYCPGPAIATLFAGNQEVWWFVPSLLVGGWLHRRWQSS